ncbi:MAG: conserved hypothetical secreted protein, partial [Solirubrobacterales bacterium]|nr:conserved hypothetical secreted protein [Solirubrobacterales bacterium]
GVGLFGFDQLLPQDGRVAASIWSWADGQPSAAAGPCAFQQPDGRWATASCAARHPAACVRGTRWTVTGRAVSFGAARAACRAAGARFAVPRSGLQDEQLRAAAPGRAPVWLAYRTSRTAGAATVRAYARCRKLVRVPAVWCSVRGQRGGGASARLVRGTTELAQARTVLRAGRGTLVLRPRALPAGRYRVVLRVAGRTLIRRLDLIRHR